MKIHLSEAARIFDVSRDEVRTWAHHFKDHLADESRRSPGEPRTFTRDDLVVLAYVSAHWEENPDIENIKIGLNRGDHQYEPYITVRTASTPVFQQPPDDLDGESRHGAIVGGMAAYAFDAFTLADSYKLAGDILVDGVPSVAEACELAYPIIFNYRHATELYFKAVLPPMGKVHGLLHPLNELRERLKGGLTTVIPAWFEQLVLAFDDFDPDSTTFRYADTGVWSRRTGGTGEFWIDLLHLRNRMDMLARSFQQIRAAQR